MPRSQRHRRRRRSHRPLRSAPGPLISASASSPLGQRFPPAPSLTSAPFVARRDGLSFGWSSDHAASAALGSGAAGNALTSYNVLKQGDKWEIALPKGKYIVRVAASGEVDAEGTPVVTGVASPARPFAQGSRTITVSDGRLTLTHGAGATDVNLSLVDITRVGARRTS